VSRASYSTAREAAEAVLALCDAYVVALLEDEAAVLEAARPSH
jgi:hypothetical protein